MYTFIHWATFTTGSSTSQNETKGRQSKEPGLYERTLQQTAGLRQNKRGRRRPQPAEWCHWCSLLSAIKAFQRCLSISASWLPPLLLSFWGPSAGPSHKTGHRPSCSILFSSQELLYQGKGIKGLLNTEAGLEKVFSGTSAIPQTFPNLLHYRNGNGTKYLSELN